MYGHERLSIVPVIEILWSAVIEVEQKIKRWKVVSVYLWVDGGWRGDAQSM